MRILSLATALMASAFYASDAALAGGTVETDTVDGVKIKLTAEDVDNVQKLMEKTGWSKEDVLVHAHGLILDKSINPETSEPFKTMSEALAEGTHEYDPSTDIGARRETLLSLFGDDLADDADDYDPADPDDAALMAFFDDLFDDDDDDND